MARIRLSDTQGSQSEDARQERTPDPRFEKFLDLYYTHFHHRWPIVHRPSVEDESAKNIILSSMAMIGAWIEGSLEAKLQAIHAHDGFMQHITSHLVRMTTYLDESSL